MVQLIGIVRRKNNRHGPAVAVFLYRGVVTVGIERPLLDVLHLMGTSVEARNFSKIGAGVDNVGIARIDGDVAAFSAAYGFPIGAADETGIAGRCDNHGPDVLLRGVNRIR